MKPPIWKQQSLEKFEKEAAFETYCRREVFRKHLSGVLAWDTAWEYILKST